ncbi:sensor histidine kinase [Pseudoxanthomonas sp. 10H]|uniref:sensor histidine kinase n=1 Tax=Pseudoxanthomonas sp. 10H TaxID=3242729 RepID=UPI0035574841
MSLRARLRIARREWRDAWRVVRRQPRRMALIAAPWLLILLVGFPLLWMEVEQAVRAPAEQAGRDATHYASQTVLRWMERLREDTGFLARLTPRLLESGDATGSPLVQTYAAFLQSGVRYHKVRWIDEAGRERLRLDSDGRVTRQVAAEALQLKADRPFFREALALAPGQVHLSPLDLNVENGRIEQPLRPTLRASSPFRRADGSRGVLVVNVHGQQLLDRLAGQARQSGFVLYLVHPQGHWLLGPRPGDAWAWQVGASGRTVERFDPALWRAMRSTAQGQWDEWTFSTLQAAWGGAEGDMLAHADPMLGQLRVLVRPEAPAASRWKAMLAGLIVLGIAVGLAVVFLLARGLAREAAYVARLSDANAALAEANERLRTVQEGLARAERLSSLGLMVAGVAHEMNTPLGSIRLSLSTLRAGVARLSRQVEEGLKRSDLEGFLASAAQAGELAEGELRRVTALIQRFKQVAVDRATLERRRFDLADAILDSDPRLRRSESIDGVAVELDLEPDVVMDSYPGPLEQVVGNLLGNALAHGFVDGGRGRIRLAARADGPAHAVVEVADDGAGIAPGDLAHVFEPFFTTARHRGGTGLGLHIVHQVVTEVLGGDVRVRSRTAADAGVDGPTGTVFTVRIPRTGPARPPS